MSAITLLNAVLRSPNAICAELSADWMSSEMPEFYLDPGRIRLGDVMQSDFWEFAETSAYFLDGDCVHFFCSQPMLAHNQLEVGDPVFVVGDFNGWDESIGDLKWRLDRVNEPDHPGLKLSIPLSEIDFSNGTGFKFVSHEGHWFSLPAGATNIYKDSRGISNYFVDHDRSGPHLLIIDPATPIDLSSDHFLVMETENQEESSVALTPGEFFLNLKSKLSLGAVPLNNSTLFRIFAPRASAATLVLLKYPEDWDSVTFHSMILVGEGVWEIVLDENLTGKYYWYRMDGPSQAGFSHFDPEVNILDPYALAVVNRLGPAIVVDVNAYEKPKPFSPPLAKDLVIGEVHVRDLIAKASGQISDTDRLGFTGMTQWLQSESCYLKEWGVNAVEIQPIQENDAHNKHEYHWGYMPVNYFSPDSNYGTDPLNASQIEEFRALVDALHDAGLAVILDVVYNHVGEPPHLLFVDKLYYFELSADGSLSNWSGCGNDLRCSTPMARRLIIDSLLHLIEFYGIDGFRFDLAELIGLDTLHEIEAAISAKHPETILIVEPWSFRSHIGSDLKHSSYLSWNDGFRNFIKQYVLGQGDHKSLQYFLRGSPEQVGKPFQTVNYTESHDDRTWIDDITQNAGHNGFSPSPLDRRRTHLMISILMMSHGTPMVAEGQDFLRSKWGVTNTYQRGDINALDYERQIDYSSTHRYFRRWIEFRKSDRATCLRLEEFPESGFFEFSPAKSGKGLAVLYNALLTSGDHQLFFATNPLDQTSAIEVQGLDFQRNWLQIADSERFEAEGLKTAKIPLVPQLSMPPVSCALWVS